MSIADRLATPGPTGDDAPPDGWKARLDLDTEDGGYLVSKPYDPQTPPDYDDVIAEFGEKPERWRVQKIRRSRWQVYDGRWLEAARIELVPRDVIKHDPADIEQFVARVSKWKPKTTQGSKVQDGEFVQPAGDLQLGKPDGGGADFIVSLFLSETEKAVQRLRDGLKRGHIAEGVTLPWLGDCLASETEIVTRGGIVRIGSVAGEEVEVRDANGGWVPVQIRSYGVQPLMRVAWKSRRAEKITYATPRHQWIVNGARVRTEDLQPGATAPKSARGRSLPELSQDGVRAGFIFGDGTDSTQGSRAGFYGEKDKALLPWFEGVNVYPDARGDMRTNGTFPRPWKLSPPGMEEGTSFLLGWLAGYFAADGCVDTNGGAILSSAQRENLEAVRSIAAALGIDTWPIRETKRTGFGDEPTSLYAMSLSVRSLPPEFFLIPAHRERAERNCKGRKKGDVKWVVESVEATDRVEEVFCCEVPTTQSFLLADGLLTSNCVEGIWSQGGANNMGLDLTPTEQVRVYRELMMAQIRAFAPYAEQIRVPVVPGNHDETIRVAGKRATPAHDSWAIEGASAVRMAVNENPELRDRVEFRFPGEDQLTITLNINGTVIGMAHGHQFGNGDKGWKKWWDGQSANRSRLIGEADLLLGAHHHHLKIEDYGDGRLLLQIPALDGGSNWFREKYGEESPARMVSFWTKDGEVWGLDPVMVRAA